MRKAVCLIIALVLVFAWLPTSGAQQLQVRAVLLTDSSTDESSIWVRNDGDVLSIAVDQLIVLESRDRAVRASYRVRHVFGAHIILEERLNEDWVAGSRVLQ